MNKQRITMLAGMLVFLGSAVSARADYSFDFNSLTSSASVTDIQNYMNGVLGCVGCVTINAGVHADRTYNGDGHVVGPGGVSATLGPDTFLSNTSDTSSSTTDRIVIKFATPISGLFSFDFEIFPDGTCTQLNTTHCGGTGLPNQPDLEFKALAGASVLVDTTWKGITPVGTTHSPASGTVANELAPQLIGTYGPTYLTGVTELDFIDWPATIGIDNLKISQVPEPRGVAFLMGGLMLALFAGTKLRKGLVKS